MRVLILTSGTRGDVQPFVALARALMKAGHETVLATSSTSYSLDDDDAVRPVRLDPGPMRLVDDPEIRAIIENGVGLTGRWEIIRRSRPLLRRRLDDAWNVASEGADLVVHHPGMFAGQHIAEKLRVPAVVALMSPSYVPTSAFPCPDLQRTPPLVPNRATYRWLQVLTLTYASTITAWRRQTLGLRRRRGMHNPLRRPGGGTAHVLHAYSRHVCAVPADWPATVHTTGYWFDPVPVGWRPPQRLADFLTDGDPPVYVGFGSLAGADPRRTGRIVLEAVRRAGVRAVLASGWGGIEVADGELPPSVFATTEAPHAWLFPRVAAVVHGGSAGTVGAAAAAGRPQVICPFTGDHPFWAGRMRRLGAASAPIPQRTLTAAALADAIRRAAEDGRMSRDADRLGRLVRSEDGTTAAVAAIEALA